MDGFEKFKECLPEQSNFYSPLSGKDISDEDYESVAKVWKAFKMENIGEYQDLLLQFDVLLLTHMFEKFGSAYLGYYRLDHGHYFSSSRLI